MKKIYIISASIVLFNDEIKTLQKTIASFLATPTSKQLFLIDNSPTDKLKNYFQHQDIIYFHNTKNLGFGKAHNLVLDKLDSKFHLILNPDVVFNPQVIPNLIKQLEKEKKVAFITPKVLYPDGSLQQICRKHPTPKEMIGRRLGIFKKIIQEKNYQNKDFSKTFYPTFIHGCFMLFKTATFKDLQGFDKRYFLYLEDADICREIEKLGKKIMYYPLEEIIHTHKKGSSKKIKLLYYHLLSAIKYFKKWQF